MEYATVCSGIEAPSVAWEPLGWKPVFFSEIETFPSKVLATHYPDVPNLGDMNLIDGTKYNGTIKLLCGGTPCQSFSVAGLRKGMDDPRGNLALVFLRIVDQARPKWVVWENVPGVLSSNGGRDFGAILGGLAELGYGWAYRVLDAQYFGVPQRRRRVFLVGCLGNWQAASAVLFEQASLRGEVKANPNGRVFKQQQSKVNSGAFYRFQRSDKFVIDTKSSTLSARDFKDFRDVYVNPYGVRGLTPLEYERLQGFPDNYTNIPGSKDGPRYKALGNSMAVPVLKWIGERIDLIDKILNKQ